MGPAEKSLAATSRWTIVWVVGLIVALTLGAIWVAMHGSSIFGGGSGGEDKRPTRTKKTPPRGAEKAEKQGAWSPRPLAFEPQLLAMRDAGGEGKGAVGQASRLSAAGGGRRSRTGVSPVRGRR